MKAMILAAGVGKRMLPLTQDRPKPLLTVGGKALIEWQLERLSAAGFTEIVVNVSHFAEQMQTFLGDGSRWGTTIEISHEPEPLETAGGIAQALHLLGDAPFITVNADVWSDFDFAGLKSVELESSQLAHLVLVDNPDQHRGGDFQLAKDGSLKFAQGQGEGTLTYAGIAVYHPAFFSGVDVEFQALRPLYQLSSERGQLFGEYYAGDWVDVGTPERLAALDARLAIY